jgi:hypothetical protein
MHCILRPYPEVRDRIYNGNLLLFRPSTYVGRVIAGGDRSPYSHVARVEREPSGTLWSLEFLQWHGPVMRQLFGYVKDYPGLIDVYRANTDRYPEYDPAAAVREMRDLMKQFEGRYGWRNAARVGVSYVPFGRLAWRSWVSRRKDNGKLAPHCSDSTSRCDIAAGIDPVPGTPSWATLPGDFRRSLLYDDPAGEFGYQFTLGAAA